MARAARSMPGLSLVTDYGEHGNSCGYCGSKAQTSVSHGMMAESMSVECYQELLDRGWRRSGRWLYCPLQARSCCQLLTIRLDVARFTPNKDQRRVARKWQAHLEGAPMRPDQQQQQQQQPSEEQRGPVGGSPKRPHDELSDGIPWDQALEEQEQQADSSGSRQDGGGGGKRHRHAHGHGEEDAEPDEAFLRGSSPTAQLRDQLRHALRSSSLGTDAAGLPPPQQQEAQAVPQDQAAGAGGTTEAQLAGQLATALQQAIASAQLPDAAYPQPKTQQPTAKQLRLLPPTVTLTTAFPLAVAAAAAKAASGSSGGSRVSPDSVAALLLQHLPAEVAAGAQVARGHINFVAAVGSSAAAGAGAAAGAAASQVDSRPPVQQQQPAGSSAASHAAAAVPLGVPRHFELRMVPSGDPSLPRVEFQLFKKYQVVHHGDKPGEVTASSFKRFLIDTPLRPVGPDQYPPGGCPPSGFGSFHQHYWLDGRLVAVGVVDLLPRCLSSKYLFWDPDLAPLSLGKLTSLREIEWVREAAAACPSLRFYYMGFYIHTCHRMRYKGDFAPSDLLCPKNKCWVPLARVQAALDKPGMVPISELPGALDGLGPDHLVDAATGRPACPPREPTEEELAAFKLLVELPGQGRQQARVLGLGLMRRLGMLGDDEQVQRFLQPIRKWWSRAGPAAAATIAFADS